MEIPQASMAIAAAEVVAALLARPGEKYPEEVSDWIAGQKRPGAALVKKAQRAVKRILKGNSELVAVWKESKLEADWRARVEDLLARLSS